MPVLTPKPWPEGQRRLLDTSSFTSGYRHVSPKAWLWTTRLGRSTFQIFSGPLTHPRCWARPRAVYKRDQPPGSRPWGVIPARSSQTPCLQDGSSCKRKHLHSTCYRTDRQVFFRADCNTGFPGGSVVKRPLPVQMQTWAQSLGREDPLEQETATHSSILAWEISWTEEPGGLLSTGSQKC